MSVFVMYYNQQSINLSLALCDFSQFVQEMYSIYSKSLLFTSISYVQERFKLNEVNQG